MKKIGYVTFHFKDTLNTSEAKAYLNFLNDCNKRLKVSPEPIANYECDHFPEVLQVLGVADYKSDYAGIRYDDITAHEDNQTLEINGGYTDRSRFDRHDLWHDRLHMVLSPTKINRPVDEGCAYLNGGSWGKTWPEVIALFKKYATDHPNSDWLKLYTGSDNFYLDGNKTFVVAYAIDALDCTKNRKRKRVYACDGPAGMRETGSR